MPKSRQIHPCFPSHLPCRLNNILGAGGSTHTFTDSADPSLVATCRLHSGFSGTYFGWSLDPSSGLNYVPPLRDAFLPELLRVLERHKAGPGSEQPSLIFTGQQGTKGVA